MSIKKMTKEDLELLSNKDITNLLLEEKGKQTTPDLFKKIIELLELPSSTFDNKIFVICSGIPRYLIFMFASSNVKPHIAMCL